jgi:hypothetical protein
MKRRIIPEIVRPAIAKPFPPTAPWDCLILRRAMIPSMSPVICPSRRNGITEATRLPIARPLVGGDEVGTTVPPEVIDAGSVRLAHALASASMSMTIRKMP